MLAPSEPIISLRRKRRPDLPHPHETIIMSKRTCPSTLAVATLATALAAGAFAGAPVNLTDTDGDGVVSAEEIRTQAETRRAAQAAQYDTDGDLSRTERRAAGDARRDAVEAQLDVDGDGTVSDTEAAGFDQIRQAMREEGGRGGHGSRHDGERGGKRGGERGDRTV